MASFPPSNENDIGREALDRWEANVSVWDQGVGQDGNKYWMRLQEPCLQRLLEPNLESSGKRNRCLELACGNGLCSRWLASHGPVVQHVLATDGVQRMVEHAAQRGSCDGKITFQKADVTDQSDLDNIKSQAEAVVRWPLQWLSLSSLESRLLMISGRLRYHPVEHGHHGYF